MTNFADYYRPRRLEDLIGQKSVTVFLKSMLMKDKVPSALLFHGIRGTGKAQPLDSKVLTPRGFVPMGSLSLGDIVADPEGNYSEVVGIYPQGVKEVFLLRFSDGTSCEATGDHLWELERFKHYRKVKGSRRSVTTLQREVRTTQEWAEFISRPSYRTQRARLVSTESLSTFDIEEEGITVDPYLLGVLLGDGGLSHCTPMLETEDEEIVLAVKKALPEGVSLSFRVKGSNSSSYALTTGNKGGKPNPLTCQLRELGVWGKKSSSKFVPNNYKTASAKTRLAVLQGLMDTDGNWAKSGAEFSSASEQLRDDVVWLARSLGLRTSTSYKDTAYMYKGEKRRGLTSYTARIREVPQIRVFRLQRKLKEVSGRRYYRYLEAVERVRSADCQCIKVSAPSSLYITDDFIPTHNTSAARIFAAALNCDIQSDPPCGNCSSCEDIFEGISLTVREIDASSQGGVDDIRALQNDLQHVPLGRRRVVILDEAHGLSRAASNALLKTLESPPEDTVFILVSTDPQKILDTIVSRCMSFRFRRVPSAEIVKRLSYICETEHESVSEDLLKVVADSADCSVREAVVEIQKLMSVGISTVEQYQQIMGSRAAVDSLFGNILIRNYTAMFSDVEQLVSLMSVLEVQSEMGLYLKDILTLHAGVEIIGSPDSVSARKAFALKVPAHTAVECMRVIWDLRTKVKPAESSKGFLDLAVTMMAEKLVPDKSIGIEGVGPRPVSLQELRALV